MKIGLNVMAWIAMGALPPLAVACAPVESTVLINELSTDAGGKIELAGTTADPVDLSGWTVRREAGGLGFTFKQGVTLAPGVHLVLTQQTDQPFVLDKSDVVLLEDQTGLLLDRVEIASGQAALSYCRIPDGDGPFQMCSRATFGEANQP
ncbi:MAG: lamin tail domain-containing protein [Byssovorax sp.]